MFSTKVNILKLNDPSYPTALKQVLPTPKQLFWQGTEPGKWFELPKVAIVGSRKISAYGKDVTHNFAANLAKENVVIISGLAFGVDAAAHHATLEVKGTAVAVLPTSLEQIYPAAHLQLAKQIIDSGGTLISEYDTTSEIYKTNFIARNRIVSGLADVLLITEAAVNSGSLHTARFALEQGKTVMVIPGNITSPTSEGCNNLIKSGAVPATTPEDIFFALNIKPARKKHIDKFEGTEQEQLILKLIAGGLHEQEDIAQAAKLEITSLNSTLTMLEIAGRIKPLGGGNWALS